MKRFIKICSVICLLIVVYCVCTSCISDNSIIPNTPTDKSYIDIVKKKVNHDELLEVLLDSTTIEQINSSFKIEFLRDLDYNGVEQNDTDIDAIKYIVIYNTTKCWVEVEFNEERQYVSSHDFYISNYNKEMFEERIKVGMPVDEVMKIDSNGDYSFLYASWTEYPKFSYHHLIDGIIAVVGYDDSNNVTSIYTTLL